MSELVQACCCGSAGEMAMDVQTFADMHALDELSKLPHTRSTSSQIEDRILEGFVDNLVVEGALLDVSTKVSPDPSAYALFFIEMRALGVVTRRCQRCLEPFQTKVNLRIHWQVMRVITDTIDLVDGHEPLGEADYPGIIELFVQEIMLYLPDIATHSIQKCSPQQPELVDNSALQVELEQQQDNRFAVLAKFTKEQLSGDN